MKPIALITGASGGIGLEMADYFAKKKYDLVLHTRRKKDVLKTFQKTHPTTRVWIFEADLTDPKTYLERFQSFLETLPRIDVFVHNAGLKIDGAIDTLEMADYHRVMDVSVTSFMHLLQNVTPRMKAAQNGRVIAISSGIGYQGRALNAPYAAAKSALHGLVASLAKELGPFNITVNAVAPGLIPTEMTAYYDLAALEAYKETVPLKRLATPLDIAKAVFFLASSEADFISGQTVFVNGGTQTH